MTRVLLFAPLYPPYSGGSPTYFSNLIDSLSEEHTFLVVTAYHPDEPVITESDGNTIYRVIPFHQSLPNPIRLVLESLTAFAVTLYLSLFRSVELAHIHATSYASPAIAVAASIADVPIIYDCRDLSFPPWIVNIGTKPLMFSCAPNVDDILKQQGIPENRIIRVPIVNPEYVRNYKNTKNRSGHKNYTFDVIYVGNLRKTKGVPEIIESFEKFATGRDDVRLRFIGDGPYKATLEKYAEDHKMKDYVQIFGGVSHKDALENIADSDVLLHPSIKETGPRSVIEAVELGTTVVATSVGIVPEIIEDQQTGLIIEKKTEEIKKSLEILYHNPKLRISLSKKAMNIDKKLDWTNVRKTVADEYDKYN